MKCEKQAYRSVKILMIAHTPFLDFCTPLLTNKPKNKTWTSFCTAVLDQRLHQGFVAALLAVAFNLKSAPLGLG